MRDYIGKTVYYHGQIGVVEDMCGFNYKVVFEDGGYGSVLIHYTEIDFYLI